MVTSKPAQAGALASFLAPWKTLQSVARLVVLEFDVEQPVHALDTPMAASPLGEALRSRGAEPKPRRIIFSIYFFRESLPVQSALQNDEIETEILRASSTSEFSHSLGHQRTLGRV